MKNFHILNATVAVLLVSALLTGEAEAKKPVTTPVKYQTINVSSNPAGAQVYANGQLLLGQTPGIITIPLQGTINIDKKNPESSYAEARQNSSVILTFVKDGFVHQTVNLVPSISYRNKNYVFDWPQEAHAELQPAPDSDYDSNRTMIQTESSGMVQRSKSDKNAVEHTYIPGISVKADQQNK